MEIIGDIKKVYNNFREACKSGKFKLDKTYTLTITEEEKKSPEEIRRIEANNKYWALLNQYVKWHKQCGFTQQHNMLMAEYAPILTEKGEDGKQHKKWVILPSDYPWQKEMYYHYKPSGRRTKDENGKEYEMFFILKKSSEMNIKEFDLLLEGLINEIEGSDAPIDCHYQGV